jgi:hypothetical protein
MKPYGGRNWGNKSGAKQRQESETKARGASPRQAKIRDKTTASPGPRFHPNAKPVHVSTPEPRDELSCFSR